MLFFYGYGQLGLWLLHPYIVHIYPVCTWICMNSHKTKYLRCIQLQSGKEMCALVLELGTI